MCGEQSLVSCPCLSGWHHTHIHVWTALTRLRGFFQEDSKLGDMLEDKRGLTEGGWIDEYDQDTLCKSMKVNNKKRKVCVWKVHPICEEEGGEIGGNGEVLKAETRVNDCCRGLMILCGWSQRAMSNRRSRTNLKRWIS